jgi:adenylate kinase family enzyme
MTNHSSALILVRGLPGSGKSHLATAIREALGQDNAVILDPDKIDQNSKAYLELCDALSKEGVDKIYFPNRFLKAVGYEAIDAGKIVIWNQAFTLWDGFNRTINSLKEHAASRGLDLPVLVVEVEINPEVAKKRISDRVTNGGHDVSDERFNRFIDEYESWSGRGFETVIVNGEQEVSKSVAEVLKALDKL